jgi:hypothetical protein
MISTFEQVWDKIDGENKTFPEILETLQEEISQREHLGAALYKSRDFKELTKAEQERNAFIQVQYGLQDLPFLDNGNESETWKAALTKRPEAKERERQENSVESWKKRIDGHRSDIEDSIWKASSRAQEGVPGTYNAIVRFKDRALCVYSVIRTEAERDVEDSKFEMSSSKAAKIIDDWTENFLESVAKEPEAQQVRATDGEMKIKELETSQIQGPNMAEVQAAEMKASIIQGLNKSADGLSGVEGRDIGYIEEGYVMAANDVKYEAQRARTADGEIKGKESLRQEGLRPLENPEAGQRVTFLPHGENNKTRLTGKVVASDERTVTLKCGGKKIPAIRGKGDFFEAPPLKREQTKNYAQTQARKLMGENSNIFFAQDKGIYKGEIIGKTPTYAIQKVNGETATLHRLKDLETAQDKNSQNLIQEGQEVSIVKDENGVSIAPWNREREEKEKVRERQKSRGSQSR